MMKKKVGDAFVLVLLGTALLTGCQDQNKAENDTQATMDTTATTVQSTLKVTKTNQDSLIVATVTAGSIPDSITVNIDQVYQRVHVVINEVTTDSLVASLSVPGTERNLRINQIMMPDGSMDGPFGHDIHYGTAQNGNYTLVIGKDNMADGQVEGPVTIYLKLF